PFCLVNRGFIEGLMQKNCLTSGCIVNKKSGIIFGSEGEAGFCNHMMDYPFGRLGEDFTTAAELQKLYSEQDEFFEMTNRAPDAKCVECPMSSSCCGGCPLQWTQFDPHMYVKGGESFTLPMA
ncbi:MAG: SPASM domain-containing protein, partial [Patescibacteria group bacterium]